MTNPDSILKSRGISLPTKACIVKAMVFRVVIYGCGRSAVRSFRALTDKNEAESKLSEMYKTIDRVAKRGIIHRNKAANLKSKLAHFTAKLA